jgi:hypothetical protein
MSERAGRPGMAFPGTQPCSYVGQAIAMDAKPVPAGHRRWTRERLRHLSGNSSPRPTNHRPSRSQARNSRWIIAEGLLANVTQRPLWTACQWNCQ